MSRAFRFFPSRRRNKVFLVGKEGRGQFFQCFFIDAALEVDHLAQRNPIVIPFPGLKFRMVSGLQVNVFVFTEKL